MLDTPDVTDISEDVSLEELPKITHPPVRTNNTSGADETILDLNPASARKAVILSEIIGPPASRRQRRR